MKHISYEKWRELQVENHILQNPNCEFCNGTGIEKCENCEGEDVCFFCSSDSDCEECNSYCECDDKNMVDCHEACSDEKTYFIQIESDRKKVFNSSGVIGESGWKYRSIGGKSE